MGPGRTQIEISVVRPKGASLPITGTGYRAHYVHARVVKAAGGVRAFVLAWLDTEARSRSYARAENAWRQLSLF